MRRGLRYGNRFTSRGRYAEQGTGVVRREKNQTVTVPCSAAADRCVTHRLGRATGDVNSLEFSLGEEGDGSAVRRPKGNAASSVPGRACGPRASSARTHSKILPEASFDVNASRRPSGEMTGAANPTVTPPESNVPFSGGETKNRTAATSTGARRSEETARTRVETNSNAAIPRASCSRSF